VLPRSFLALIIICAAGAASGQEAKPNEMQAVTEIAQCMVEGLPDDWVTAHMIVELANAGASTGGVRYLVGRKDAQDQLEPFTPCDTEAPAKALIGLRDSQPADRRGWSSARLVVERDGKFRLNYDFPK
jgi:hypothetical protein